MMKCVVSGCPHRIVSYNHGVFQRTPRRFFTFPTDPNRVKVWLAALREMDKDASEQLVICEDHFLRQDISRRGLSSNAIPITPPFFGRPLSLMGCGGAESGEEDEQWAHGEEEEEDEGGENPPKQDPGGASESPPLAASVSDASPPEEEPSRPARPNVPLSLLTRGLMELLLAAPGGSVDLGQVASSLQTSTQRVRSVVRVLDDMELVQWDSDSSVSWIGGTSISSFMWRSPLQFLTALEKLQLAERKLERLIRSCAQQLLDLTESMDNAALAYVTCEDVARIASRKQTIIIIKAPPETRLHVPEPEEDRIQLHLVAEKSPITAVTYELGSGGIPAFGPSGSRGLVFSDLESRIRPRSALSDWCGRTEEDADGGSKARPEAVWKTDQMDVMGQTYTVQTKYLSGRPTEMGPPCQSAACLRSSKHACSSITEAERERIFTCFWEDMDWEQRQNYMCSLVDILPVQRRRGSGSAPRESSLVFHLNVGGWRRRVCRTLFLATFGLKESVSLKWIREKKKRRNWSEGGVQDFPAGSSRPAAN